MGSLFSGWRGVRNAPRFFWVVKLLKRKREVLVAQIDTNCLLRRSRGSQRSANSGFRGAAVLQIVP